MFSWYAILAGMGIFPDPATLRAARADAYRLTDIDDLLDRSAQNFPDHRACLGNIPRRRSGDSLQVYFW